MRAGAQGGVPGTVYASISSLSPAQRYVQICPGQREADTGGIIGLVRDADDNTTLPSATVSTQWIDVRSGSAFLYRGLCRSGAK